MEAIFESCTRTLVTCRTSFLDDVWLTCNNDQRIIANIVFDAFAEMISAAMCAMPSHIHVEYEGITLVPTGFSSSFRVNQTRLSEGGEISQRTLAVTFMFPEVEVFDNTSITIEGFTSVLGQFWIMRDYELFGSVKTEDFFTLLVKSFNFFVQVNMTTDVEEDEDEEDAEDELALELSMGELDLSLDNTQ